MLTAKKKSFVDNYMLTRNASDSARKAGYSPKTCRQIGSRLLKDVDVEPLITAWEFDKHKELEIKRAEMSKPVYVERVWTELDNTTDSPSRIRALELAGKALGHVGNGNTPPSVTNNTQINVTIESISALDAPSKWANARKLLQ